MMRHRNAICPSMRLSMGIIMAFLVISSAGLKCYTCSSSEDKPDQSCLDPDKNKGQVETCEPDDIACRKTYNSHTKYMSRGCTREHVKGCPKVDSAVFCFCKTDLCNNEPGLMATKGDGVGAAARATRALERGEAHVVLFSVLALLGSIFT